MSRLYIDSLLCADPSQLEPYRKSFEMLLAGQSKSVRLEKLKNTDKKPVYSIRLSDCARAILTVSTIQGKKQWVLLSLLEHHEYDRERTLQEGGLTAFFERNRSWLAEDGRALQAEDFEPCEETPVEPSTDAIEFSPAYQYQSRFLSLSINQASVLQLSLPAMITGGAGAGKTLLGFLMWQQYLRANPSARILLVSPNKPLAHLAEREYQQRFATSYPEAVFRSCTYEGLSDQPFSDEEERSFFNSWLETYRKKPAVKSNSLTPELTACPEEIFYEFRVVSGYTKEDYFKLGARQASDSSKREWLWTAYQNYLQSLKDSKLRFAAHLPISEQFPADLLIIDEFQGYSFLQIQSLLILSPHVLVLGDPNQATTSLFSPWNYFKEYFFQKTGRPPQEVKLTEVHRCSGPVTALANEILTTRNSLLEGLPDRIACPVLEPIDRPGQIFLTENSEDPQLLALDQQTSILVISSPEHLEEAKRKFNKAVVLTADQCAGLEADVVVIYRLFDHDPAILRLATALKQANLTADKAFFNRSKTLASQQQIAHARQLHRLFVLFTRARHQLILVQERFAELDPLWQAFPSLAPSQSKLDSFTPTISTEEMIDQLLRQGLSANAIALMQQSRYTEADIASKLEAYGLAVNESAKPNTPEPSIKTTKGKRGGKKPAKGKGSGSKATTKVGTKPTQTNTDQRLRKLALLFTNFERNLTEFLRAPEAVSLLALPYQGQPAIVYILKDPALRNSFTNRLQLTSPLPREVKRTVFEFLLRPLKGDKRPAQCPIEVFADHSSLSTSALILCSLHAVVYDSVPCQSPGFKVLVHTHINGEILRVCAAKDKSEQLFFLLQRQVLDFSDDHLNQLIAIFSESTVTLEGLYQLGHREEEVDRLIYKLLFSILESIKLEKIVSQSIKIPGVMVNDAMNNCSKERQFLISISRSILKNRSYLLFLRPGNSESLLHRLLSIGGSLFVKNALDENLLDLLSSRDSLTEKHGDLDNLFVQLFYSDYGVPVIVDLLDTHPDIQPILAELLETAGITVDACVSEEQVLILRQVCKMAPQTQPDLDKLTLDITELAMQVNAGKTVQLIDENRWLSRWCNYGENPFIAAIRPELTKHFLSLIPGEQERKDLNSFVDLLTFIILRYLYSLYAPANLRSNTMTNASLATALMILYYGREDAPPCYSPIYQDPNDPSFLILVVNEQLPVDESEHEPRILIVFREGSMHVYRGEQELAKHESGIQAEKLKQQIIFNRFAELIPATSPQLVQQATRLRPIQLQLIQAARAILEPTMRPGNNKNPLAMLEGKKRVTSEANPRIMARPGL